MPHTISEWITKILDLILELVIKQDMVVAPLMCLLVVQEMCRYIPLVVTHTHGQVPRSRRGPGQGTHPSLGREDAESL